MNAPSARNLNLETAWKLCVFRTVIGTHVVVDNPLAGKIDAVYVKPDDQNDDPPTEILDALVATVRTGGTVLLMTRTKLQRDRVKALVTALGGGTPEMPAVSVTPGSGGLH